MKIITTFIACFLCFGSLFGIQNAQRFEKRSPTSAHSFELDSFKVVLNLAQGWVPANTLDGAFEGIDFSGLGMESPLSFCFERENKKQGLYEAMGVVALRFGDATAAEKSLEQLKTVFIPTKSFKNGFESRLGPGLLSYTTYGTNLLMVIYVPDEHNKNSLGVWRQIQGSIHVRPLSSR